MLKIMMAIHLLLKVIKIINNKRKLMHGYVSLFIYLFSFFLLLALHTEHLDTAKLLIENGADINAKYKDGNIPLFLGNKNNNNKRKLMHGYVSLFI